MSYEPPAPPVPPPSVAAPRGEIPLWAPYYNAPFGVAIKRFFTKYADFTGRASRSEFWWAVLGVELVSVVLVATSFGLTIPAALAHAAANRHDHSPGLGGVGSAAVVIFTLVTWAASAGVIVPLLALTWRRLHDTNRSGAVFFLALIPWVGGIILLVFTILQPDPAGARFDRAR